MRLVDHSRVSSEEVLNILDTTFTSATVQNKFTSNMEELVSAISFPGAFAPNDRDSEYDIDLRQQPFTANPTTAASPNGATISPSSAASTFPPQ
jgi:hypothetical protein